MKRPGYPPQLAEEVRSQLEELVGPDIQFDQENGMFHFVLRLSDRGRYAYVSYAACSLTLYGTDLLIRLICPVSPDPHDRDMMTRAAEFVTRVNCGLFSGKWELDMENGELLYSTHISCIGQLPHIEDLKEALRIPVVMFRRYIPGLLRVLLREQTPQEAVAQCEDDRSVSRPADRPLGENFKEQLIAQLQKWLDWFRSDDREETQEPPDLSFLQWEEEEQDEWSDQEKP